MINTTCGLQIDIILGKVITKRLCQGDISNSVNVWKYVAIETLLDCQCVGYNAKSNIFPIKHCCGLNFASKPM